ARWCDRRRRGVSAERHVLRRRWRSRSVGRQDARARALREARRDRQVGVDRIWLRRRTAGREAVARTSELLTIHTKGRFKSFYTCGSCVEPEMIWKLAITPDGVRDLGTTDVVPVLRRFDEL